MGDDRDDIGVRFDAIVFALQTVIGEHLPRSSETGREMTSDEMTSDEYFGDLISGGLIIPTKIKARVDEMIKLGWSYSQITDDYNDADNIAGAILFPTGAYDAWDAEKEEAKLDEILRTARDLIRIWNSLHITISTEMEIASGNMAWEESRAWAERKKELNFGPSNSYIPELGEIFYTLPRLLEQCVKVGKDKIRHGRPLGRRKWQAVTVIASCRDLWHQRTGDKAPSGSDLDLASPFGMFVQDVFDALGIKVKPRSAMHSWNEVQS